MTSSFAASRASRAASAREPRLAIDERHASRRAPRPVVVERRRVETRSLATPPEIDERSRPTGAEHLLENVQGVTWAACARNAKKAEAVLAEVCAKTGKPAPPVEVADLVCADAEAEEKLRAVVKKARVVLTTAGPFEKYGQTLVKLCAEEGVHYADITGETDFVRKMIEQHDATARKTGASIVPHCGNDCAL